jgi:hypothetical protein
MLYDFQHLLTQTKVCFCLASKILLKMQQVSELLNIVMSPRSIGGGSEGVLLKNTQLWYLDIQDKDPIKTLGLVKYKDDCDA